MISLGHTFLVQMHAPPGAHRLLALLAEEPLEDNQLRLQLRLPPSVKAERTSQASSDKTTWNTRNEDVAQRISFMMALHLTQVATFHSLYILRNVFNLSVHKLPPENYRSEEHTSELQS